MTDAEKNPRRYVLLKEMRAREGKRDEKMVEKENEREAERGEGRTRERVKKPSVLSRSIRDVYPISRSAFPSHARLLKPVEQRVVRKLIPYKCCREYREDFTLPKIH